MVSLVLVEHDNANIKGGTLATVTAAKALGQPVHLLVAGQDCGDVATAATKIDGVQKVYHVEAPELKDTIAEHLTAVMMSLKDGITAFLAPASTFGKNTMPRLAALLDTQQISDIIAVEAADTFRRPIYAGNAIATVKSAEAVKVITVRPTAFDNAATEGGSAEVVTQAAPTFSNKIEFVNLEASGGDRPDLSAANVVVSGGRGVGSAEDFKLIEQLADKLGAAVGASRAAVDSGYVPNDYQVGQTGKIVAPQLYIAVGISGAIQHLAGMSGSKVIVAINKDPDAPIFEVADYGLEADLFDAVPELIGKL